VRRMLLASLLLLGACHTMDRHPRGTVVEAALQVPTAEGTQPSQTPGQPTDAQRALEAYLRQCFTPPGCTVEVDWVTDIPGLYGRTETSDGLHFLIHVCPGQSEGEANDTVIHEWAHVMAFGTRPAHGPAWGLAYSWLWSATHGE
jgi:hypothetical protein